MRNDKLDQEFINMKGGFDHIVVKNEEMLNLFRNPDPKFSGAWNPYFYGLKESISDSVFKSLK